jgi:hypothetical protein
VKVLFVFAVLALAGCDKLQPTAKGPVDRNTMIGASATCPSCGRVTDAEFCAMEKRDAAGLKSELPLQIDYATKLDGMMVSCSLRFVTLNKSIALKLSMMRPGWQAMAQSQLNQNICENPLFVVMVRRGWTFAHKLSFLSGEQINQRAICSR